MRVLKVQLNGMPLSPSGYGELSRYYLRVLRDMGHDVRACQPQKYCDAAAPDLFGDELCAILVELTVKGGHVNPDVTIDCAFPEMSEPRPRYLARGLRVGCTMYETDPLPRNYVNACNAMAGVVVPGPWGKGVFERSGVTKPVRVVRPGTYEVPQVVTDHEGPYRFLSVHTWQEERKNPRAVLTAYLSEFRHDEPVELVLRTGREAYHCVYEVKMGLRLQKYPVVRVIHDVLSSAGMALLYRQASCYVSAHCAEGFGLPMFEAQARGIPVIATDYSESTCFLNEQTGYPVSWSKVGAYGMQVYLPRQPGYWDDSMTWASIDVMELQQKMRHVFEHQDEARSRGAAARKNVLENFNPGRTAGDFEAAFSDFGL